MYLYMKIGLKLIMKNNIFSHLFYFVSFILSSLVFAEEIKKENLKELKPTSSEFARIIERETFWRVKYFIDPKKPTMVFINAGLEAGLADGTILHTLRYSSKNKLSRVPVETGMIKIKAIGKFGSLAEVLIHGSPLSKSMFPRFSGVMAGDFVRRPQMRVERQMHLIPEYNFSYIDLFIDPKQEPRTFELSTLGRDNLAQTLADIAKMRFSLVFIEGYTDYRGPSRANQIESYQRALTVKQFMVERLGFDEDRLVVIGLGEEGAKDETLVQGFEFKNRRIVIKVVQAPADKKPVEVKKI